ncbi:MAG: HEAT repeat domain-containing protein [Methanosarcina barkeri]|nr:HEAT repeat domain-containing protein [Methanosarcina sp. ERenArc_MAG2]
MEPLIRALGDEDPNVRVRAAEALGRIGDKRAVVPLTDALNDENEMVRTFAKLGLKSIGSQRENTLIATYGKEGEFYIEDQRREWYDQLDTICKLARNDMEPYMYPEGSVVSYGWGIENRIGVGILEGSEVNNSTLDNIYGIFDMMGKEIGVNDVPVVFRYEESVQTETAQEVAEDIEKNNETEETDKEPEETDKTAGDVQKSTPIPEFKFVFSLLSTLTAALYMNKS